MNPTPGMVTALFQKTGGRKPKGSGKGFGRQGNPKGQDGNTMKCHTCGSTEHFKKDCKQSGGSSSGGYLSNNDNERDLAGIAVPAFLGGVAAEPAEVELPDDHSNGPLTVALRSRANRRAAAKRGVMFGAGLVSVQSQEVGGGVQSEPFSGRAEDTPTVLLDMSDATDAAGDQWTYPTSEWAGALMVGAEQE